MAESLLLQWRSRVQETEEELARVEEDMDAVLEQRKSLKSDIRKFEEVVQREKEELLHRLEEVEAEAKDLGRRCDETVAEKDRVEAVYMKTLDEYESMHEMVHRIKDEEERYKSRQDLEVVLQKESLAWAEEEHHLRDKLRCLHENLKDMRKQQKQETDDLEEQILNLEQTQQMERARRQGEAKLLEKGPVAFGGPVDRAPRSIESHAPVPQREETRRAEESFVSSYAHTGCPTRHTQMALPSRGVVASAPVSRDGSSSIPIPNISEGNGTSVPRSIMQQIRAYSYSSGKELSRKRDVLGDSTNKR